MCVWGLMSSAGNPQGHTCSSTSAVHTNGTASFALLVIYQDASLPLRSINVFGGMQNLFGTTETVLLPLGDPISSPALGTLTAYILEGDLYIDTVDPAAPCGGAEFVAVNGQTVIGSALGVCQNDADNPAGNIWNGTLNTEAALRAPDPPSCTPAAECCTGPHVCGLAGVDIDRYDISAGLEPLATEVQLTLGTGSDRIALSTVVAGVNLYQPLLAEDSSLTLKEALGPWLQLGGPASVSLAVSNTGNLAADGLTAVLTLPGSFLDPQAVRLPEGATATWSSATDSQGQTSHTLSVSGFSVGVGKVAEVLVSSTGACAALGSTVTASATVQATGLDLFALSSPAVQWAGPGVGACYGLDLNGPLRLLAPVGHLSGGGCQAASQSSSLLTWAALAFVAAWRGLRRRPLQSLALSFVSLVSLVSLWGCGNPKGASSTTPRVESLTALPSPCGADNAMAQVTKSDGSTFCIDRFEAQVSSQGQAEVVLGQNPSSSLTWYAAQAACVAANKRLCTVAEWTLACGSSAALAYPYGDVSNPELCNGYARDYPVNPASSGTFSGCVGALGVYDMSGNLEEWLADAVDRVPGSGAQDDRAIYGGSWQSNSEALRCTAGDVHDDPNHEAVDRGFRCCR